MRVRRIVRDEQGETLLELVIAIMILGVCVVGIGAGMVMSVKISGINRQQAVADAYLHNYAETLQGYAYRGCTAASTPDYSAVVNPPLNAALPAPFSGASITVSYWDPTTSTFMSTCPAGGDSGLQKITFSATTSDNFVHESLVVVKRIAP